MEYTVTFTLTDEQEEQLSRIAKLFEEKTGNPIPSTKLFSFILSAGSSYMIDDKLDFFETNLQKHNRK